MKTVKLGDKSFRIIDAEVLDGSTAIEGSISILEISILVEIENEAKESIFIDYQTTMIEPTRPSTTLVAYTTDLELSLFGEDEDEVLAFLADIALVAEVQNKYDTYVEENYKLVNPTPYCIESESNFLAKNKE